jgi:hypothetical protein
MDGSLNDNMQPQTGMRRLFQLRQHAQNIITRSMSQMTDVSQRGAMSDMLSESGESHLKDDTHYVNKHIQTLFPTTFAGAQAQAFGHKTTLLAATADTHSLVDSQSSASVSSTISALDKPVYLRRRRYELKFLEFCENGEYRERSLARQDILNEVHGLPNEVPDFIAGGHKGNHVPKGKPKFTPVQRGVHHPDKPKFEDKDTAWDHRQDRSTNQKRQAPAAADPTISLQTKRGHDHLRLRSSRMSLTMRDMRQVDPAFTAKAALWVRQKCIVVSLEHVRAIILHDKLLLFDPDNESVKQPIAYIQQRLAQGVRNSDEAFMPFEFRALEGILIHSCISVERDFHKIERSLVGGILETLPTHSSPEHLERLRVEEQSLNYFNARLRKFQAVLQTLLDSDEDMANMYLTEKQKTPLVGGRNAMDHDEAEMLLESYLQVADDISTKAGLLNRAIDDTENLIEIHLNTNQNKLLQITVTISVAMLLIGFATMIFGIFGMNLTMVDKMHNLPDSQYFFYGTAGLTVLALGISAVSIAKWSRHQGQGLFKWQRLRLGAHRRRAVVVVGPKVPVVGDARTASSARGQPSAHAVVVRGLIGGLRGSGAAAPPVADAAAKASLSSTAAGAPSTGFARIPGSALPLAGPTTAMPRPLPAANADAGAATAFSR